MKRVLTLLTLVVWAALMLWFWGSGRVASYLHPQFHPYVAAAGFVLAMLAPLWWWATRQTEAACNHAGCHDDHGHDHEPRSSLSAGSAFGFVVLLLPVSAAALISPSQFGEAAVMNRGIVTDVRQLPSATPSFGTSWQDAPKWDDESGMNAEPVWSEEQEEGVEYFTRTPEGAIQVETLDLLFAAQEPGLREVFQNQRVAIVGQYVPPRGGEAGGFDLVRMFVVCCAADARPLGIKVTGEAVAVPRMGWVRITGVARFGEAGANVEPTLELEKIEEVEAPRESFLY
jgi:uncharacterized repeat protein (TIGR03943 family)